MSREGPFDIHQDHPRSVASPQLMQDTQGCLFRMASYDVEAGGPNFSPAYGVQLHDQRLLEYVGAPESERLTSHSPEYWVHHMGREKALSAALQLQHDAGLILSNVHVLQQLVTAINRASSDVLRAVHGRQPIPANAIQQGMPSFRVRRTAHYMMAMGLWQPPGHDASYFFSAQGLSPVSLPGPEAYDADGAGRFIGSEGTGPSSLFGSTDYTQAVEHGPTRVISQ